MGDRPHDLGGHQHLTQPLRGQRAGSQPAPGRPKAAEHPLGGQERSDVGAGVSQPTPGRPKAAESPLGGQERSDVGADINPPRPGSAG